MRMILDYNNVTDEKIGKNGISKKDIKKISTEIKRAEEALNEYREKGSLEFMTLPYEQKKIIEDIKETAEQIKEEFDNFVIVGIGGSSLGPKAFHTAINSMYYNERKDIKTPKIYFSENIDPHSIKELLKNLDLKKTVFNIITKSGNTAETMSKFMIIEDLLKKEVENDYNKHIICTTDKYEGSLAHIAKSENYKTFIIPKGVGGRFSELTPVGLLAAAVSGANIDEFLLGAEYMDKMCMESYDKNPAYMYSIIHYIAAKKNKSLSVMMPYSDSLKNISDWYAQLWAESIGKKYDRDGNNVNVGQTPIKAVGTIDQHSQIQLYAEGPDDKIITFIEVEKYRDEITIPNTHKDEEKIAMLGGVTENKLIQIEKVATEHAITKENRMNLTIKLPEINEFYIGGLFYFFEIATSFMGELLNINAFDQPGVEEGKLATYALLGRADLEEKRCELEKSMLKSKDYII